MLGGGKFQEFPMFPIGLAIGIFLHWMRRVIFFRSQAFSRIAFLKLNDIRFAEDLYGLNHFFRKRHVSFVVTGDFGNYFSAFSHEGRSLVRPMRRNQIAAFVALSSI